MEILEFIQCREKEKEIEVTEGKVYVTKVDDGTIYIVSFILSQSGSLHRLEQETGLL